MSDLGHPDDPETLGAPPEGPDADGGYPEPDDEDPFLAEGEVQDGAEGDGFDLEPDEHPANRFLGREFLAWIWYRVERDFGRIELPTFGTVDFWVDDRLTMRGRGDDPQTASFRGGAPSSTEEARAALRAGKIPEEARIGLRLADREYVLSLRGETLDVSGLKVPQTIKKGEVEAIVYDRMFLFEEAMAVVGAIYDVFLQERLSDAWERSVLPRMREWIAGAGERAPREPSWEDEEAGAGEAV